MITREEAYELLKKYNKDEFHLHHGETVEGVMRWYANQLGYGDQEDFWGIVGLLHDIDFEMWPEEHCVKAPELLKEAGVEDDMIHDVGSNQYRNACFGQLPQFAPYGIPQHRIYAHCWLIQDQNLRICQKCNGQGKPALHGCP